MGNWSKLKADEKVRVIKFARQNGVSDMKTIRDTYNLYSNGGHLKDGKHGNSYIETNNTVDQQKQWLQNWYAERLPIIDKEELLQKVEQGLKVPYQTPDMKEIDPENYIVKNDVKGSYVLPGALVQYGTGSYGDNIESKVVLNDTTGTSPLHEFTHATQFGGGKKYDSSFTDGQRVKKNQSYYEQPSEQHARIMELRYINNLDPKKTDYTLEEVKNLNYARPGSQYRDLKMELNKGDMGYEEIQNALNTWASNNNTFEQDNGMYLSAFGGPLTHKKSTGGPLYPFSFEKNIFLKTPVVRYDEGGFFARLFGKKDTPPTPEEIKAERVERFINDTWETEYSVPKGYDSTTGLFYPYKSPEGGTKTIGPGFKLRKDGSGDNTMFSAKEAAKGVTREQINEKLRAQGELQYDKVLEFLNQKGNRLPVDTINPNIMNGLMDLRFQVGALGGWDNLREAVLNGDLESIKKESLVTFKDANTGKIKPDVRRNELRAEKFWHYD